ncbi:MAG: sigma factor, partial [Polyangia bacterium]
MLRRLARRMSAVDADDLVQETFVRALAACHRYE